MYTTTASEVAVQSIHVRRQTSFIQALRTPPHPLAVRSSLASQIPANYRRNYSIHYSPLSSPTRKDGSDMKSSEEPKSDPWLYMFLQRLPIPMALWDSLETPLKLADTCECHVAFALQPLSSALHEYE
jgi:hypothetical protein